MLDARYWISSPKPALPPLDVGCWMLDVGCWMLDVACCMLDVGCWLLDVGCWMLDLLTPISPLRPPVPSWEGSGVGNSALRIPHSAFNRPAGFSLPAPASACHEYRFAWSPRPRVRANPAPSGYPCPSPAT